MNIPAFHEESEESLFQELRVRAKRERIGSPDEYRQLIQELIQEKVAEGIFDPNEDLPTIERDLGSRWSEIEAGLR